MGGREWVRLGAVEMGLDCLRRFAQLTASLPEGAVRIVGTNALREAVNRDTFIRRAEDILGHPVEVISGREEARLIYLGAGSRPHGVIVGPDGAPWVTDQGLNAIVRVDPRTDAVKVYRVTQAKVAPHTATFDGDGILWFTGAAGYYGKLDPRTGRITALSIIATLRKLVSPLRIGT